MNKEKNKKKKQNKRYLIWLYGLLRRALCLILRGDFNFESEIYGDWVSFKYDGEMREKNFIGRSFRCDDLFSNFPAFNE